MYTVAKYFTLICVLGLLAFRSDGVKKDFPELTGHTLEGKTVTLPRDIMGKYSLIGVACSIKAQDDLNSWVEPLSSSLVGNIMYPINMYFVPMIGNIKIMSKEKVEAKIKESLDQSYYKYILIYPGEVNEYLKNLDMKEKDKPYFFCITPEGKINYVTSGKYSDDKLEKITDHLSED